MKSVQMRCLSLVNFKATETLSDAYLGPLTSDNEIQVALHELRKLSNSISLTKGPSGLVFG